MIRRVLETGYNRTLGALRNALLKVFGRVTNRTGLVQVLYLLGIVGLMAGFVNAVFFPVANQGLVVYPGGGAQTIPEAVIDSFVVLIGGSGIYIAYLSGRQTTRSRMVNLYLAVALLLIAVSVFMGIYLSVLK